eukprot:6483585-Amphidinium_carterae.2
MMSTESKWTQRYKTASTTSEAACQTSTTQQLWVTWPYWFKMKILCNRENTPTNMLIRSTWNYVGVL